MCSPESFVPKEDEFVFRVGEQVTCENDHVICVVKTDVKIGQTTWPSFHRWRDPEPTIGTMPPIVCCRCNTPWLDGRGFHIRALNGKSRWVA
jgi:hypothetical protein